MKDDIPLILGGHSFIAPLGNDPYPDEDAQIELVEKCLDKGITWFDTTYQPERVNLGKALAALGRRDEATIIAWNFYHEFDPSDPESKVGGPSYYTEDHLPLMQKQLQTDVIDCVVVHGMGDETADAGQEDLAASWIEKGYVKRLGTWAPSENPSETFRSDLPYSFMVKPYNITAPRAGAVFKGCKDLGWENMACSPFVRGWEMENLKKNMSARGESPEQAAELMLRYSMFGENVDRLIVSMRKPEWIDLNIRAFKLGPLSEQEESFLLG